MIILGKNSFVLLQRSGLRIVSFRRFNDGFEIAFFYSVEKTPNASPDPMWEIMRLKYQNDYKINRPTSIQTDQVDKLGERFRLSRSITNYVYLILRKHNFR